jgi:Na+/H+-translocating membrane pyrophosphatase
VSILWAYIQFITIRSIPVEASASQETDGLANKPTSKETTNRLLEIYNAIYEGAQSFLRAEYSYCAGFVFVFANIVFFLVSWGFDWDWIMGAFTTISFVLGALTSMLSGYLGMKVAVYSNVRTTISAQKPGWTACFNTAFRAGAVMGFALCGLGMLILYITMLCFRSQYEDAVDWIHF